ncbi:ATP-dependent helicase [Candidatus Manganitrophus noduliformans]|uniref:DNA 3'-5' helicase n=1 Tax=Candidatus Manganitrophus noduliformans TaxID=2606439 RepID=A0A7X6DR15_9BACT|nr:ATP-dependent DNA helicase [Candidatus Manganitrophus noduliformans]NKE71747.1 ATP-dependent helicase [Candidatus Manganitrophus noduliformans]
MEPSSLLGSEAGTRPLSPKQKAAVEHGEGPLLIIAGAGTGKTLVITRRIAHLISTKKAKPHEILALTFTEKAAKEMEERVDLLVPYGYTGITISTFHAFGDRILREHGLRLGLTPDFRVLSRPEQVIFFRKHLFSLPLKTFRPLGNPTKHIEALLSLFSRAKDEDVGPEAYLAYADRRLTKALATPEDSSLLEEAAFEKELAETYRHYQDLLMEEGCIDFGDQVSMALRLLRENPTVLKKVQSQFRYILVDEFQDTNFAQFQLVRLLSESHHNVTVVGDDDQSIYKFRGAAISNILGFGKMYHDAKRVVLTENYRSVQPILDVAYRLIQQNNPDRLEVQEKIDKRLISQVEDPAPSLLDPPVVHLHYDTLSSEADAVARIIAEEHEAGLDFGDVAILVRGNADADSFLRALNVRGIPYRFTGNRGLYSRPEVRLLIAFMRAVADFHDSSSLYYLATSELYRLPDEILARCNALARRKNQSLYDVFKTIESVGISVSPEAAATLEKLLTDLQASLQRAREVDAGVVLYEFIRRSGLLEQYAERMTTAQEVKIQNVARFFEEIRRFQQLTPTAALHDVVAYLDLLIKAGEDPPAAEADVDASAVSVLTIHKSKGLEFDTVFMVGLVDGKFPSRERSERIELPVELIQEVLPQGDFHIQEERRLFYVGMTRARRRLYLTSARDIGGVRERKVSPFVLEALNLPIQAVPTTKASALEAIARHGAVEQPDLFTRRAPASDEPLYLTHYQIDDYSTCPLKYKYTHILRVPIYQHHAVLYGNAMHQAVAAYLSAKMTDQTISFEEILVVFNRAWRSEGFLSRQHEEQRLAAGRAALQRFYDEQERGGRKPTYIEKEFSFTFEGNRIAGRWDRVDETPEGGVIIDYKTAEVHDQKTADKKAKENPQLTLYAWSYRERFGTLPVRVELHFLDSGFVGTAVRKEKEIEKMQEKIRVVAEGIRKEDFEARPTYIACQYCAYQDICPNTAGAE